MSVCDQIRVHVYNTVVYSLTLIVIVVHSLIHYVVFTPEISLAASASNIPSVLVNVSLSLSSFRFGTQLVKKDSERSLRATTGDHMVPS